MGMYLPRRTRLIDNHAGWKLEMRVYRDPDAFDPGRPPLVMIPGYAMNSFILAYHPREPSMVEFLARRGWEVWTCNLRGQGGSLRTGRAQRFGMAELALEDLPAVFAQVRAHTEARVEGLTPIGCSLGASLMFAYLAHHPEAHGFRGMIAVGGPLRWDAVHPLLQVAFRSAHLAGAVRVVGTRQLAAAALPLLTRVPALLSPYMNAARIDLSSAGQLVQTVEDPIPYINRQVARWVQQRDLVIRGLNVPAALGAVNDVAALAIYANADGIVPAPAARSLAAALPAGQTTLLEVGDAVAWYAHADLFIGDEARPAVFEPMAAWLDAHARGA